MRPIFISAALGALFACAGAQMASPSAAIAAQANSNAGKASPQAQDNAKPAKAIPAHGPLPNLVPAPRLDPAPPLTRTVEAAYKFLLTESYPAAVGASDNLIGKNPKNAAAIAIEAFAMAKFGNMTAARPLANQAPDLTTNGPADKAQVLAYAADAVVADKDGHATRALQAIQKSGNIDPALGVAYLVFADMLNRANRVDPARQLLNTGLRAKITPAEARTLHVKLTPLDAAARS